MNIRTITLPRIFAEDHINRECASGILVRETKRTMTFEMGNDDFEDWLSDARYYSDAYGFDFEDQRRVCRSAKRCVEILEAEK